MNHDFAYYSLAVNASAGRMWSIQDTFHEESDLVIYDEHFFSR